jgi:hypothetical protein
MDEPASLSAGRTPIDDDVDEEIRFHLASRIDELEASGLSRDEGRRQALAEFGSVDLARDDARAAWQFRWLDDAVADLRYALGTFRRSPGFVITAVLSLALGIGATSGISVPPTTRWIQVACCSQLPAIQSAALAEHGPLGSRNESRIVQGADRTIEAQPDWVSPGFFDTIGVPRMAGRDFTISDRPGSPYVAIVSQWLAVHCSTMKSDRPDTAALARRPASRLLHRRRRSRLHYADVHRPTEPVPWFTFHADDDLYMPTLFVRGRPGDPAGLLAAVRGEFDQVDRGFPVFNIKMLQARIDDALGRERMIASISAAFGGLALLLAAIGIYGALACSVARRRREIGIRVALGSTAGSIVALVAHEGLLLAGAGIIAGIAVAVPGSWILAHYLPGLSSRITSPASGRSRNWRSKIHYDRAVIAESPCGVLVDHITTLQARRERL